MKNRLLGVMLALIMALVMIPTVAMAEDTLTGYCGADTSRESKTYGYTKNNEQFTYTCYSNVSWTLTRNSETEGTYTLTISGTGAMADFPSEGIAPWCLCLADEAYKTKITKIVIGDGVTVIGQHAFLWCGAVEKITFREGLEEIHKNGFHSLTSIEEINLPGSLVEIGNAAFWGCKKLKTVSFKDPGKLTTIGPAAFGACSELTDFNNTDGSNIIPENVTMIGSQAFVTSALTNVTIPAGVETLKETFRGCTKLTSVTFAPNSKVKELLGSVNTTGSSRGVFSGTSLLTSIDLPESVETIGDNCFLTSGLTSISIPAAVRSIGVSAFDRSKLTSVTFAEGSQLKEIGERAFDAIEVEEFVIPEGVESVGNNVLDRAKVTKLIRVPSTLKAGFTIGWVCTSENCVLDTSRTTCQIGTNGTTAYSNRYKLIYIPSEGQKDNYPQSQQKFAVTNGGIASGGGASEGLMEVERAGYTFGGWYYDSSFNDNVEESTTIDSGKNYYAKWVSEITFDANGGHGEMQPQTVGDTDETTVLTANTFTKTGYRFTGWNTKPDGTGISYVDGATGAGKDGSVTLYAQWTPNTYTIKFNANGGSGEMADMTMTYDQAANLSKNTFKKDGSKFAGWTKTQSSTTTDYADGVQVKNLTAGNGKTIELYAVWTAKAVWDPTVTPQTYTYNGEVHAFVMEEGYTVGYKQDGAEVTDPTNAGKYDVVITRPEETENDGHAAYNTTVHDGLVINPAVVTIKADDKSVQVGDQMPAFSYTKSGRLYGSDQLVAPTYTCETNNTNTAGNYKITPKDASIGTLADNEFSPSSNYEIGYETGTLTVSEKPAPDPVKLDPITPVVPVTLTPYSGGSSSSGNTYSWYFNPTPTPTPVPVAVVLPKTGDMTIWQSILSFFGII